MLKFDNVSFRYPNQSQNAITDISFEIKKGEFVLQRKIRYRQGMAAEKCILTGKT